MKYIRILICLIYTLILTGSIKAQGLQFQGMGVLMEERASYSVFNNSSAPRFKDDFSIKFDISFPDTHSFGHIFLLQDPLSQTEYNLIYSYHTDKKSLLRFNIEGKNNLITMEIDNKTLANRVWVSFTCTFLLKEDKIILRFNNQEQSVGKVGLNEKFQPDIIFGKNKNSVDMPFFRIRNLSIGNEQKKYEFPLNESAGNDVHDRKGKITGHVTNPVWLTNNSFYWKYHTSYESQKVSGVNYYSPSHTFFFFNQDSLISYNMVNHTSDSHTYANTFPGNMRLGSSFITPDGLLYVYEVCDYTGKDTIISVFNPDTHVWTPISREGLPVQLHHHAGFADRMENRYIIFGGFGNQRYNKEFLSFDLNQNQWDTLHFTGDPIMPRYFQGLAYEPNKQDVYIFGGMGNESGDQTIGKRNFYDLYRINLEKMNIEKLWDLPWTDKNMVPARNMILLEEYIYAICYPEYKPDSFLQLYRFSVTDGSFDIVSDSIGFRSDKIATNANLYYNDILKEFYCSIQVFEDDGSSTTHIYSLSSPPVTREYLELYANKKSTAGFRILLLFCPFLLLIIITLLYKKKKQKPGKQKTEQPEDILVDEKESPNQENINSIYLFGEFTVFDRNGKDITYMFSTRLKSAFLLIIQNSLEKGITSQLLSTTLWPDKDEYSVKNLRGVTINQIRKILVELDGIELIFQKGYFQIVLSPPCYCDLFHFIQLIEETGTKPQKLTKIKDILSRGLFLESQNEVFMNPFKEKIKTQIETSLPIYAEESYKNENYLRTIQFTEILLSINPLNEQAFHLLIQSLYHLKQINEVKKRYSQFCILYQKKENVPYPIPLTSIISSF